MDSSAAGSPQERERAEDAAKHCTSQAFFVSFDAAATSRPVISRADPNAAAAATAKQSRGSAFFVDFSNAPAMPPCPTAQTASVCAAAKPLPACNAVQPKAVPKQSSSSFKPGARTLKLQVEAPPTAAEQEKVQVSLKLTLPRGGAGKISKSAHATTLEADHRQALSSARQDMTRGIFYDEAWKDKQERTFARYLSFIFDDAGATTTQEISAPRSRLSIHRAFREDFAARSKLRGVFEGSFFQPILFNLDKEIKEGRLCIRTDRDICNDVGLRDKFVAMLHNYHPFWLRAGLEAVLKESIPRHMDGDDRVALTRCIKTKVILDPSVSAAVAYHIEHSDSKVVNAAAELRKAQNQAMLKKVLCLIMLLDKCKSMRILTRDPCLFSMGNGANNVKSSKALLINFAKDYLSGEGDIEKHLRQLGFRVEHEQSILSEVDFSVTNLAVDLRDGVRLAKLAEIVLKRHDICSALRMPAVSGTAIAPTQKVHNLRVVLKALESISIVFDDAEKVAKDVSGGNREVTLQLLWNIFMRTQIERILPVETIACEIMRLRSLFRFAASTHVVASQHEDRRFDLLLKWCQLLGQHYGVRVCNFTSSFSDGAMFCIIIHHYIPELLPLASVYRPRRMQSHDELVGDSETVVDDLVHLATPAPDAVDAESEKRNFRHLHECLTQIGGVPQILRHNEMVESIPDNKTVMCFVAHLFARIVECAHEYKAASSIQKAWRRLLTSRRLAACIDGAKALHRFLLSSVQQRSYCSIEKAALVMQRVSRAKVLSMRHASQQQSCICIQTSFRVRSARRQFQSAREQARLIAEAQMQQACAIVLQARSRAAVKHQQHGRTKANVIKFQAAVRGRIMRKRLALEVVAMKTVKRYWRAAQLRQQYVLKQREAVTVQRYARGWAVRRAVRLQHAAATKVQTIFRGYITKKVFEFTVSQLVKMQSVGRMFLQRSKFTKLRKSAVTAQKLHRGRMARKLRSNMMHSLVQLQTAWRCASAYRKYQQLRSATVVMQKYARGWAVRRAVRLQHAAATKVQTIFRGYITKLNFVFTRGCIVKMQSVGRMFMQRRLFKASRRCIVKIQSLFRGFASRRISRYAFSAGSMGRAHQLATLVQSWYRACTVRKSLQVQRSACAAIQAWWRKRLFHFWMCDALKFAPVIQRFYRRRHARRCAAATRIQVLARSWLKFRTETRMDRAAVVVQSVWRGRMVRARAGKMLVEMRARIAAAKAAVQEHMKLGNRTRVALDALLSSSSVAVCLKAISALEVASEHSIVCALQIVQQGAVPVIYRLMGQCNRSITSQQLQKHAVRTLANLCNSSTYASRFLADVWTGVECVVCLADIAVAASENPEVFEPIVKVLCTLLAADSRLQLVTKHAEAQQKLKLAASTLERRQKRVLGNASSHNVKADGQKMMKRTGAAAEAFAALVARFK